MLYLKIMKRGEIYEKSNMKTYITICKIDSQWEFAVRLRKLKQGLSFNLERWDAEGGGREFQKGGEYMYTYGNWCFWTVMLEKTLESPLDYKEIQPVHPKGDQSWVFIGRTDVEAETPVLWPSHVKSWLIWKDPDAGKDWGQGEKGTTEDEMVGLRHRLNGHGFGWTTRVGDWQGGLACCGSWDRKELDTTE